MASTQPMRVYFAHIPKTAGTSLITEMIAPKGALTHYLIGNRADVVSGEVCVPTLMEQMRSERGAVRPVSVVFLRAPRTHLVSMHAKCNAAFISQRAPPEKVALKRGVMAWVTEYEKHVLNSTERWGCYSPYNMQTRAFLCDSSRDVKLPLKALAPRAYIYWQSSHALWHSSTMEDKRRDASGSDIVRAIDTMRALDVVGVTEYYLTSLCLVLDRVKRYGSRTLPPWCDCRQTNATAMQGAPSVHKGVNAKGHVTNSAHTAEQEATLSQVLFADEQLYAAGLVRFREDVRRVEAERSVRLLCD